MTSHHAATGLDFIDAHDHLTNSEVEEMDAAIAGVPDADWDVFFEATYVDPMEV